MNGAVEGEALRPRPLSAGIWTLFSWLRRTERSSSSESVSSVGSDRTVASFDFLAPFNYKKANAPLVLPQDPLTETYKKRLQDRNLRRQHDRDVTLRRKYGLFREEALGYDAFSLPSARRLQKDSGLRQDRERRATSESIQRRSAYVPGKRPAPLPPAVSASVTLPRNYKRKRPAPKPPVQISEANKENVEKNKMQQMETTSDIDKHSFPSKDITLADKPVQTSKHETKEMCKKMRAEKSFLKQIFDSKKRNSSIETSRIKLLPSISELDKQAADIIEASKALRGSGHSHNSFNDSGVTPAEDTWTCTTCLRKYKPVVSCCIYCIIKENTNNKATKTVCTDASNTYTQTDANALKSSRIGGTDDKKKLREMLKEMKDSLPKRPKQGDNFFEDNKYVIVNRTETPTLRVGSIIDENLKPTLKEAPDSGRGTKNSNNYAKEVFFTPQPSSSNVSRIQYVTKNIAHINKKSDLESSLPKTDFGNVFHNTHQIESEKESNCIKEPMILKKTPAHSSNDKIDNSSSGDIKVNNEIKTEKSTNLGNINKNESVLPIKTAKVSIEHINNNFGIDANKDDNHPLKEMKKLTSSKDNLEKNTPTEIHANISISKIILNNSNQQTALANKLCDKVSSDSKDKIDRIKLDNVDPSKIINVNGIETGESSNSKNITLHTPLKVSSLLNPLYLPKYKTPNDNISNCNFANVLVKKTTNVESNKKELSPNQQTIWPTATSLNVKNSITSSTDLLNANLNNLKASPTEALKIKNTFAIVEDPKRKTDTNASPEDRTITSNAAVSDPYDRRRNLINQLEQAISNGDEQLAAITAAKLAKLKLACSVLSFSSQIITETITPGEILQDNISNEENKNKQHTIQTSAPNVKDNSRLPDKDNVIEGNQQVTQNPTKKVNILPTAIASTSNQVPDDDKIIEIWVEDKEAARGPIPLRISRRAKIGELKRHVESSLGLEIRLQRWIVGRTLCTDDSSPLAALAGPDLDAPFYLCLVESETNKGIAPHATDATRAQIIAEPIEKNNIPPGDVYTELMKLEQQALVPNTEVFECGVCMEQCAAGTGVVLRECIHTFCRECLAAVIRHCEEPVVACPAIQCPGALQEREIRAILSAEEHDRWLARGLAAAESGTRNTFHCRTRDCGGWAFCEPEVRKFPCPICKHTNCVPCQAVHENETCRQYQEKLREAVSAPESSHTDEGTQALLKSLISQGEALECPECSAIITKKWGCDWVKCLACKTEICWVTKGRRWGPGGKGDTSGGCRCRIDGKKCHPLCGYCH